MSFRRTTLLAAGRKAVIVSFGLAVLRQDIHGMHSDILHLLRIRRIDKSLAQPLELLREVIHQRRRFGKGVSLHAFEQAVARAHLEPESQIANAGNILTPWRSRSLP